MSTALARRNYHRPCIGAVGFSLIGLVDQVMREPPCLPAGTTVAEARQVLAKEELTVKALAAHDGH